MLPLFLFSLTHQPNLYLLSSAFVLTLDSFRLCFALYLVTGASFLCSFGDSYFWAVSNFAAASAVFVSRSIIRTSFSFIVNFGSGSLVSFNLEMCL